MFTNKFVDCYLIVDSLEDLEKIVALQGTETSFLPISEKTFHVVNPYSSKGDFYCYVGITDLLPIGFINPR